MISPQRVPPNTFQFDQGNGNAASSDIDEFIYLISHDVRASVRALLELPQWITEDLEEAGVTVNGQVAQSIALMNRHTGRLDRMMVDLLCYSRVGRLQSDREIMLDDALDSVLDGLEMPPNFKVERHLECLSVTMGDRDLLTLFDALIGNAIKHHDKEAGKILVNSSRDGGQIVLRVSDDGPGIEAGYYERAFGAMTTLRPRDEVEGSGMGLAIVRKIADFYGGSAELHPSPYGRGTSVVIRLPERGFR